MDNLLKSLPGVLRATSDSPEVKQAAAFAAFTHIAGDGLRSHAVPRTLTEHGTLVIAVADKLWEKQLDSMVSQLIFRTNTLLGSAIIKRLEFEIDPSMLKSKKQPIASPEEFSDNEVPLELWAAANAIQDKELRRKFLRTAVNSIKRQERK